MTDEEFEHLRAALGGYGQTAASISGDLEDGINADHLLATAERDGLLAALAAAEADRDRARDAAVALEQENAWLRDPTELGDEDYNAVIEALVAIYGRDAEAFVSVIETARDEEAVHTTDNEANECVDDCLGCFTERLADGITRTVNGGGH